MQPIFTSREHETEAYLDGAFPLAQAQAVCERKRASIGVEIAQLERRAHGLIALQQDMRRLFGHDAEGTAAGP